MSSLRSPASSSAPAVASATSSSGVTPGPTSPSRDSATPATATAPRSGSAGIEDDPLAVLAGAHVHPDAHVVRRDAGDLAHDAKPLVEVDERDVVALLARVHGRRRVHDAVAG